MKKSKLALLLVLALFMQSVVFTTHHQSTKTMHPVDILIPAYTPHAAMNISSNADFAGHGWNGSGTIGDPYSTAGISFDMMNAIWIAILG